MSLISSIFRRLLIGTVLFGALSASAATYTFNPNDGVDDLDDFNDFDHYSYYTWGFKSFSIPTGQYIVSAKITITNINNWDAAENGQNWLNMWLLDGAASSAQEAVYNSSSSVADGKVTTYSDSDGGLDVFPTWQPSIAKTKIATYTDWNGGSNGAVETISYTFSPWLVNRLTTYINNGNNFALGFDPDCHYWNTGVQFQIVTSNVKPPVYVPEGATTAALLGLGFGAMLLGRRMAIAKAKR